VIGDFAPEKHGFKVEVSTADRQNKPDIGVSIVREWFDVKHVDAIADVMTSLVTWLSHKSNKPGRTSASRRNYL
jgi:branched-chain amino acid transport system substrate-binding protein